ncbi:hypothetical protein CEB3_c50320 [Peptococcaceae bacterium CEB3]|nr:hypothetical protein CEB3_c50320 [Peptococcaceae bacterium CEB3]
MTAGQWFRLEWKVGSSGTQTLNIYLGANLPSTTPTETITAPMATGLIDYLEWGPMSNPVSPTTHDVIFDEIMVRSDAYPGPLISQYVWNGA